MDRASWGGCVDLSLWLAAMALALPTARAQTTPAVVSVDSKLTATNNGGLAESGRERTDFIASVRPALVLAKRGPNVEFDMRAAATLLGYANGTQRGGILPDLQAALKSTVLDRWLYFDAQASVRQSEADPFGARADETTGANRRTESRYRLSPYLEREFAPSSFLYARHDLASTTNGAGDGARLVSNQSVVRVERKPVPLGASVELSSFTNDTGGSADSRFRLDSARVGASLAFSEQFVVGALVGRDRSEYLLSEHSDSLYGVSLLWRPSPRTDLWVSLEHRFFGQAGNLNLQHRTPLMAFAIAVSRQPVGAWGSLGIAGRGTDIRTFLDAILTTRYPDAATRQGVVDSLVTSRGLDTHSTTAVDVVARYPQLLSSATATWTLLGSRNTASLTFYTQTARQLARDGVPLVAAAQASADNRQRGGTIQFNRRLAPQLSAEFVARWSRIDGLAARDADVSDEKSLRFSLMQNLSARTGVSAGVQRTRFTTTVAGQNSYDATLAFVGMRHRF